MAGLLIGDVAGRTGLSAPTIRYYERIGLLTRPARSAAGYRRYNETTVEELRFIRKAQALGFSLEEIGEILKLSRSGRAPCAHVLDLARRHLAAVDERIKQLGRFREQLAAEIHEWDGKRQPTCEGSARSSRVPRTFSPSIFSNRVAGDEAEALLRAARGAFRWWGESRGLSWSIARAERGAARRFVVDRFPSRKADGLTECSQSVAQ